MQPAHCSQRAYDEFRATHRTHCLSLKWKRHGDEAFNGERHHEPCGTKACPIAEERKELAEEFTIINLYVDKIQPLYEEAQQETGVAHGQRRQVETRRQFAQLRLGEHNDR